MKHKICIKPIKQTGHICKPTAIAILDQYYAEQVGFKAIPLNKKNNPLRSYKKNLISMRELAKKHGSIQGELLELQQVEGILKDIGYEPHLVDFKDQRGTFRNNIIENINKGYLIFASFSVDLKEKLGLPTVSPDDLGDKNEHAAMIHGYDEEKNILYFTHWGREWSCTFEEFYNSSMVLLDTRSQEHYENVKKSSIKKYKYDLSKEHLSEKSGAKDTLIPGENTGFCGKLLIVPRPKLDQINSVRARFITEQPKTVFSLQNTIQTGQSNTAESQGYGITQQIKHIAQVFCDGDLGGTPLEGYSLAEALIFFEPFLESIDDPILSKLAQSIEKQSTGYWPKLQEQLSIIKRFAEEKKQVVACFQKQKNTINLGDVEKALNQVACNLLDVLDEQLDLFISGGFSGHPGHAVMYRLVKQLGGSFHFCVYDSNSWFHETTLLSSGKLGHYPIVAFNIPQSVDRKQIVQFLTSLFKLEVLPDINSSCFCYNEQDLYQIIRTAVTWFKGSLLRAEKFSEPISGQRSGTCTWKSIEQWLQAALPNRTVYRQFLLAYRLYCFQKIQPHFKRIEPEDRVLLKRALANLARMLDTELKQDALEWRLEPSEKQAIITQLNAWKKELKRKEKPQINTRVRTSYQLSEDTTSLTISSPIQSLLKLTAPKTSLTKKKIRLVSKPHNKSFDEGLDDLYQCLKILHLDEFTVVEEVEAFCVQFTTRQELLKWKQPPSTLERQQVVMEQLQGIIAIYHRYYPKPTPRSIVVSLSLMSLVDRLGQEGCLQFGNQRLSGLSLHHAQLSEWIERLSQNPFLSTFDPKLDYLWEQLRQYYDKSTIRSENPIDYYKKLMEQANPSEKEILKTQWEQISNQNKESVELISAIGKLFQNSQPSYYCYLNQKERSKIVDQLPELNQVFRLQRTIETVLSVCLRHSAELRQGIYDDPTFYLLETQIDIHITKKYIDDPKKNELAVELIVHSIVLTDDMQRYKMRYDLKSTLLDVSETKQSSINNVLLSGYEGNAPNSQEIPYLPATFRRAFSDARQHSFYPIRQMMPSAAEQLTLLMHHIRISPSCQVITLLSELLNHSNWLANTEWEPYILLTLFQPGSLLDTLRHNSRELWCILDHLWQKNNTDPAASWFLLKYATRISCYAVEAMEQGLFTLDQQPMLVWQQRMFVTVEGHLKKVTLNTDRPQLKEWHHWRLVTLVKLTKSIPKHLEEAFLASYWFLVLSFSDELTPNREDEYRQGVLRQAAISLGTLKDCSQGTQNVIKTLLLKHNFSIPKSVQVDTTQRTVTLDDGVTLCFLPQFIYRCPEFSELFGQYYPLMKKQLMQRDQDVYDVYSWTVKQTSYRVLYCAKHHTMFLQKRYHENWYTYAAPSKAMQQSLGFAQHAFTEPPTLLEQADLRVWVADNDHWMIVHSGQQEIVYSRDGSNCTLNGVSCQLDPRQSIKYIPELFSRFEDSKFIHVLGEQNNRHWQLVRYGLDIISVKESNIYSKTYQTSDKKYKISIPKLEENWFGTGLIFEEQQNKSRRFLVMPLQPYYIQKNQHEQPVLTSNKTQYVWIHDLSDHLAQMTLFGEKKPTQHPGWQVIGNEHMVFFEINQQGELVAVSTHDKMYLAYLYLAQDHPKKALECIRNSVFQGTVAEMERLWWLITKLPANGASIRNSRILAVQLAALQAMLKLTKQYPHWQTTAIKETAKIDSNTKRIHQRQYQELLEFVDKLPQHLEQYYIQYDRLRNNIPVEMRLHSADEKLLLSHCLAVQQRAAASHFQYKGTLGIRYLERFPEQGRLAYMPVQCETQEYSSYCIEPKRWAQWLDWMDKEQRAYFNPIALIENPSTESLNALHPFMNTEILLKNVAIYYHLARTSKEDTVRATLKHFCETTVACYAALDDKNRKRDAVFLVISELLWVALHQPSVLLKADEQCLESKDQMIHQLTEQAQAIQKKLPPLKPCQLKSYTVMEMHQLPEYLAENEKQTPTQTFQQDIEFLSWSEECPSFNQLYKDLARSAESYESKKLMLLKKLEGLPQKQREKRLKLEEEYLNLQKDRDDVHIEAYKRNENTLNLKKSNLGLRIEETRVAIHGILNARQPQDIIELGKTQRVPTLDYLVRAYPKWQDHDWIKMGICSESIQGLWEQLSRFFSLHDQKKRRSLLEEAFQVHQQSSTYATRKKLGQAILSQPQAARKQEALFEYANQLALHPEQAQFINTLLKEDGTSKVLQLRMGGGKSKVILPLWAYTVADGEYLPVVLVHDMSLQTNFCDLTATSLHSFQQEPYCLYFDRYHQDDPASLQTLYDTLETVRLGRRYIVSTPSTWQSIELKYLELLHQIPTKTTSLYREQQLVWLGKILSLLRNKGVAAIDEAHALLHIRKELNYALGEPVQIDLDVVDMAVDLYLWLDPLHQHQDPNLIMEDSQIKKAMGKYIHQLCYASQQKEAPYWITSLLSESLSKEHLQGYLLGQSTEETLAFLQQRPQLKKRWIFLREQFQNLLPLTLRRKLYEHYGPSFNAEIPFAIPYRANNTPTSCFFGYFMETVNYTTQMMLARGVSRPLLKDLLNQWQEDARLERLENGNQVSHAEQQFALVFSKEFDSLLELNVHDMQLIERIYQKGHHHPLLLGPAIRRCLQRLLMEPYILQSNPINLVSQFQHVIAMTGTPNNYQTYHQRIELDTASTLGVEAQVKSYLKTKSVLVQESYSQKNIDQFLKAEIGDKPLVRALIDYGGFFCGLAHLEVAQLLSQLCVYHAKNIQYILFYQGDKLYAWDIKNQTAKRCSSSASHTLDTELGCTAQQRFTYYDQEHTLGSDIAQDKLACGILTVDINRGEMSKFLQAAMRLRGLEDNQSLILVTNESNLSLASLLQRLENNEHQLLQDDHFRAALKKIHNLFRDDLLQRLLKEPQTKERDVLFQHVSSFFIVKQEHEITALYEHVSTEESTEYLLQQFVEQKKCLWESLLKTAIDPSLNDALESIIAETVTICSEKQWSQRLQTGNEVQIQQEKQKEIQQEKEQERLDQQIKQTIQLRLIDTSWINPHISPPGQNSALSSMQQVISAQYPNLSWAFDANLYASPNFLYSYPSQQTVYNAYTKPALAVLWMSEPDGHGVCGVLICMEEAAKLRSILLDQTIHQSAAFWMTTLNGDGYLPKPLVMQESSVKKKLQTLLEQAQFLTGSILELLRHPLSSWFQEHIQEKSDFLKAIAPYVGIQEETLDRFDARAMNIDPYLAEWIQCSQTTAEFLKTLALRGNTPKGMLHRLEHMLPRLEAIQKNALTNRTAPLADLLMADDVYIHRYAHTLQFVNYCANDQLGDAAHYLSMHQAFITFDGFKMYVPHQQCSEKMIENYKLIQQVVTVKSNIPHSNLRSLLLLLEPIHMKDNSFIQDVFSDQDLSELLAQSATQENKLLSWVYVHWDTLKIIVCENQGENKSFVFDFLKRCAQNEAQWTCYTDERQRKHYFNVKLSEIIKPLTHGYDNYWRFLINTEHLFSYSNEDNLDESFIRCLYAFIHDAPQFASSILPGFSFNNRMMLEHILSCTTLQSLFKLCELRYIQNSTFMNDVFYDKELSELLVQSATQENKLISWVYTNWSLLRRIMSEGGEENKPFVLDFLRLFSENEEQRNQILLDLETSATLSLLNCLGCLMNSSKEVNNSDFVNNIFKTYRPVANSFAHIIKEKNIQALDANDLQKKFGLLNLSNYIYVDRYLTQLKELLNRSMEHFLSLTNDRDSFVNKLTSDERKFLSRYFDRTPLSRFFEKSPSEIDLEVLCSLHKHPAFVLTQDMRTRLVQFILNDSRLRPLIKKKSLKEQDELAKWSEEDVKLVNFLLEKGIASDTLKVLIINWDTVYIFFKWAKKNDWSSAFIKKLLFDEKDKLCQWWDKLSYDVIHQWLEFSEHKLNSFTQATIHTALKELSQIFTYLEEMEENVNSENLLFVICFAREVRLFLVNEINNKRVLSNHPFFQWLCVNSHCEQLKKYLGDGEFYELGDTILKIVMNASLNEQATSDLFEDVDFIKLMKKYELLNYFISGDTFDEDQQCFVQFLIKNKNTVKTIISTIQGNEKRIQFALKFIWENEKIDRAISEQNKTPSFEQKDLEFLLEFFSDPDGCFANILGSLKEQRIISDDMDFYISKFIHHLLKLDSPLLLRKKQGLLLFGKEIQDNVFSPIDERERLLVLLAEKIKTHEIMSNSSRPV